MASDLALKKRQVETCPIDTPSSYTAVWSKAVRGEKKKPGSNKRAETETSLPSWVARKAGRAKRAARPRTRTELDESVNEPDATDEQPTPNNSQEPKGARQSQSFVTTRLEQSGMDPELGECVSVESGSQPSLHDDADQQEYSVPEAELVSDENDYARQESQMNEVVERRVEELLNEALGPTVVAQAKPMNASRFNRVFLLCFAFIVVIGAVVGAVLSLTLSQQATPSPSPTSPPSSTPPPTQSSTQTATEVSSSLAPTVPPTVVPIDAHTVIPTFLPTPAPAPEPRCPTKRLRVYRVLCDIKYDGDGSEGEVRVQFQDGDYWPRADACAADCPAGGPVTLGCDGRACSVRSAADAIDLNNARAIDLPAGDRFKSLRVGLVEEDSGGFLDPDETYAASAPAADWYDETCADYDVIVSWHPEGRSTSCVTLPEEESAGVSNGVSGGLSFGSCASHQLPSGGISWYISVQGKSSHGEGSHAHASSSCDAHEKCAALGLTGVCCPTNEDVTLGCCS